MSKLEIAAVALPVLVYGGSGIVELPQWRKFVDQFVRWGFPAWWAAFNPALKIVAAGLTLAPPTRPLGLALCVAIALGAVVTVLRFNERALIKAALPVAALTLLSAVVLLT